MDLFDHRDLYPNHPGYRSRGGDTSRAAAESMKDHAPHLRERVRKMIAEAPDGLTYDEICVLAKLGAPTVSARLRELVLLEQIIDTGDRRATRSGRTARVYKLKPETV
jgi:hypothetical protein